MIIPDAAKMELATALAHAPAATERAALVRAYAKEWGVSEATARRHGERTQRVGASRTGYPVGAEVLDQVLGLWLASATEKYRHATMPLGDLIDMCETSGILAPGQLSLAQLTRYIREQHLTLADQRRGAPAIHLASRHPNHVHLTDVTRCRQWYLTSEGRPDVQSYRRGTAEYRNRDLRGLALYRYVVVDHTSGLPYVQYMTDETAQTLLTFLAGAWFPKKQRREAGPTGIERWWPAPFEPGAWDSWTALPALRDYHFRGAPRILILDRASQNQSEFTRELCTRLGIQHVLAQEARAKGSVESMMWIWERKFEARLAVQPAPDLRTLNVWALDFLQRWCLKTVHSRHGRTRSQAWAEIQPEELRELPPWPIFRELARRAPEARTVKSGPEAGTGLVYHEGRAWRVPDGVALIGQPLQVSHSAFSPDTLEGRTADGRVLVLEPLPRDRWGFFAAAPVVGERYARHADTATQETQKRVAALRQTLPPLQVFGREGEQGDTPTLLPPRHGVEISVALDLGARELGEPRFTARAVARLGRALTEAEGAERDRRFSRQATLPERDVEAFVGWCRAAAPLPKVINLHR